MRPINVIIAVVVTAWLGLFGWGAYRVYQSYTAGRDPLRAERLELQRAAILRDTEKERQKTEEQKRETARTLAAIDRRARLESNQGVNFAAVVLAVSWRMSFPILFFSGIIGAGVYVYRKPVLFEFEGVRAWLPRHAVPDVTAQALVVQERKALVAALAYAETVTQGRVEQIISAVKAVRPGRETVNISNALPAAAAAEPSQAPDVPTFSELFSAGKFTPGKPLVFGFREDGQPKTGTWTHAYSLGIAGMSGSGKSSTIRLIMSESLLTGAVGRFYVIDPHYPHPESLLASLGDLIHAPQVIYAENPLDTAAMIADIHAAIDRRLACEEASDPLLVVVVDELPVVVKKFPKIAELIERIGMESRKAGVYGIFSAQSWNGDKTGGTTARDNLTALLVHKMKRKQAQTLLQDTDLTRQVLRLQPGQVLFSPTKGDPELLTVPFCAVEDMPDVVRTLSKSANIPDATQQVARGGVQSEDAIEETGAAENSSEGKSEVNEAVNVDRLPNVVKFPVDLRNAADLTGKELLTLQEITTYLAPKIAKKEVKLTAIAEAVKVDAGFLSKVIRGQKKLPEQLQQRLTQWILTHFEQTQEA